MHKFKWKNEKIKIGYNKLFEIQKICWRVSEFDQNIQKQKSNFNKIDKLFVHEIFSTALL